MAEQITKIKIEADASALPVLRRELLKAFGDTGKAVEAARQRLKESQLAAQELGRAMTAAGTPSKELVLAFDRAREAVRGARTEVLSQTAALSGLRGELTKNAAVQAAAQAAARQAAASEQAVAQARRNRAAAAFRAAEQERAAMQAAAAANLGTARSHQKIREGVDSISTSLNRLQGIYAGVLVAQGLFASGSNLAARIDEYRSLEARLKLASASSREFAQAQEAVFRISQATGQPLAETGQLYTRLAGAVRDMGRSQAETGTITEAVALALRVSGATSAEAGSAMLQLSQAFASGALRGEEFNAVSEAAPRLMKALADALGVSTGALKQMAQDGKLSADVLADALGGSLEKLRSEAAGLPETVGQATQNLSNQFSRYIEKADEAYGVTRFLVRGIKLLSENLETVGQLLGGAVIGAAGVGFVQMAAGMRKAMTAAIALRGAMAFLTGPVGLLVGAIVGIGGAWLLSSQQAKAGAKDVQDAAAAAAEAEKQRADVLAELNARIEAVVLRRAGVVAELEKKQADAAKKASKEQVDSQIADQKRLVEAVRAAIGEALAESRKLADEGRKLREQAVEKRASRDQQAADKRLATLPEEQQQEQLAQRARQQIGEADTLSARATLAGLNGQSAQAKQLSDAALKAAEEAARTADRLKDPEFSARLIEQIGAIEEAATNTQAKVAEAGAAEEQARADQLGKTLATAQAGLDELVKKAAEFKIDPDITAAEQKIATLDAQIKALKAEAASFALGAPGPATEVPAPQQNARGGLIRGAGSGTSDSILSWLSNGEYVIRAAAVNRYGPGLMHAINNLALPGFANGGLVSRLAIPSAPSGGSRSMTPVNLNLQGVGSFPMQADADVIGQVRAAFAREALKRGRR